MRGKALNKGLLKKSALLAAIILVLAPACKKKEPTRTGLEAEPGEELQTAGTVSEPRQPDQPVQPEKFELGVIAADGSSTTLVTYNDGQNIRQDKFIGAGQNRRLQTIVIVTSEGFYVLNPETKTGMKMAPTGAPPIIPNTSYQKTNWAEVMKELSNLGASLVQNQGTQTWQGIDCQVFRVKNPVTNLVDDYFIHEGKIKRILAWNADGKISSDIRINQFLGQEAIPKDAFQIPQEYQIQEMGGIQEK